MTKVKLGLIGDNISNSLAPKLHQFCGRQVGLDVSYELFSPAKMALSFEDVFAHVQEAGLRGVNITMPYKERVMNYVTIDCNKSARIGSCNTICFKDEGAKGFNTDYTGFISAYRASFGNAKVGKVALFGAGGVGKAIAHALIALAADEIVVIDTDGSKARVLIESLSDVPQSQTCIRTGTLNDLQDVNGVLNCTPLGMFGYQGTPVPEGYFPENGWAFDAVYTPVETRFKYQAEKAKARFLTGFELFLYQGIHAFEQITGRPGPNLQLIRDEIEPLISCKND